MNGRRATRDEILWAAGFFEGEGSVGGRHVLVSQVNRWPLERLMAIFGGNIGQNPQKGRVTQQPCWQWAICGDQGRMFVELIYPHLSPKRQRQIDEKFVTEEKRQRRRQSHKAIKAGLIVYRQRDEKGRLLPFSSHET